MVQSRELLLVGSRGLMLHSSSSSSSNRMMEHVTRAAHRLAMMIKYSAFSDDEILCFRACGCKHCTEDVAGGQTTELVVADCEIFHAWGSGCTRRP
jgi:hypothetical protein